MPSSEELSAANPSNTNYREDAAFSQMGIGECLYRLGRHREALRKLGSRSGSDEISRQRGARSASLMGDVGRIHRDMGNVLLAMGDETGAHENYRLALAATEELIRRAPSSLYFQRQNADALESLGRYYATLARRRPEFKTEARAWLQKSLAVWQDWTRRKIGAPYAGVRERQVAALIASLDKR